MLDQLGRHGCVPRRLCQRIAIAAVGEQTGLVLDLHHRDRAVRIGIDEVADQRLERRGVGLAQLRAEDRENRLRGRALIAEGLHALRFDHDAREPPRVAAHPCGRVGRRRVLERAEPQEHQTKTVRRAPLASMTSTSAKSNVPSTGSLSAQLTGESTTLAPTPPMCANESAIARGDDDAELNTCPPTSRAGSPSRRSTNGAYGRSSTGGGRACRVRHSDSSLSRDPARC